MILLGLVRFLYQIPVAVRDPEQLGSDIESKTDWCIPFDMRREQLIVECIWTKHQRKVRSCTAYHLADGLNA